MRKYDSTGKTIKINSFIISLICMAAPIAGAFSLGFGINDNANAYIVLFLFALLVLRLFFAKKNKDEYKLDRLSLVLIIFIFMLYILTIVFQPQSCRLSIIQFVFYAIMPICFINLNFNTEYVLRYCLYLSLFTVFPGDKWFDFQYVFLNQANMGSIYPIVTVLIVAMIHFKFYRTTANTIIKICYIYSAYLLVRLLMVANRGAALSIFFCVIILSLYSFDKDKGIRFSSWKVVFVAVIGIISGMLLMNNLVGILEALQRFFYKYFDNVPSVILKMHRYAVQEDIMNGRLEIYQFAWDAIKKSPIYGHGLCTFYNYSKGLYIYPHNFILQHLFEGGILFAFAPILLTFKLLMDVILGKIKNKSEFIIATMLLCQCIPKLLLSTDAWYNTALWMMIAFSAMRIKKKPFRFDFKKFIEKSPTV